jgi:hypothetical protein
LGSYTEPYKHFSVEETNVKGSFAAFLLVVVAGCACYRSSQEVLVHVTSGVPTGDIAQMGENADNASTRATFGQVIRLPHGSSGHLVEFTLWLSDPPLFNPDPLVFSAYVMAWDGEHAEGPVLYKSPPTNTAHLAHGERGQFRFSGLSVPMERDRTYVIFVSCSEYFDGITSEAYLGSRTDNPYPGGNLCSLNNGSDFSKVTCEAWHQGMIPWDLAFDAVFSVSPELPM